MVINTNIEAQTTTNNLNASQAMLAKSLSRLSSGSKIIVPSDDAAGLAVSSRLNSQIKRLDSALNNVINSISFTQTQDGFMKTIDKAFRRMGELAMLSQDTTKSDDDRALYNQEFLQLKDYVTETAKQDFNGVSLFAGRSLDVTVDANGTTFTMVGIDLAADVYTTATNPGTESWRLTADAYKVSKDGYQLKTAAYKTTVEMWRNSGGTWSTTDNGGVKFAAGSIVSDDVSSVDTAATSLANGAFVSKTVTLTGFTTDYLTNKLTKSGHGLVTGNSIKFNASTVPAGAVAGTTYYVNVSGDDITLHTTKADATNNASAVNFKAATAFNTTLTATAAASSDLFTVTNHGLANGDKVRITSGAPTGTNTTTTYYVKLDTTAPADKFELYTDSALSLLANVTADGTGISIESNKLTGISAATTDVFTKASHGLSTGDIVQVTSLSSAVGPVVNTSYHAKKITDDTFELYTTSALTTKVDVTTATTGSALRLNIEGSVAHVENTNNVLKKGNYVTANPITTGEDLLAVKIGKDQDVAINAALQDISAFATRNNTVYYDDVNLKTVTGSQVALDLVKKAITQVATDRAKLGAVQSRLNFTNDQLTVTKENLSAAISRIADVDVAEEATQYARFQILVASGTEMLKQANQLPQSALTLLR